MEGFKKKVLSKGFDIWRSWNRVLTKKVKFDYQNRDKVIYGDKFAKFLTRFRENEVSDKENNLAGATDPGKGWLKKKWNNMGTLAKATLIGAAIGSVIPGFGIIGGAAIGAVVG